MILRHSGAWAAAGARARPSAPTTFRRCERIPTVTRHCQNLQVGQTVRVDTVDVRYRITVLASDADGHKLIEKGEDYVVIDDPAGEVRTRIPMHLIQSVVTPSETAVAA